MKDNAGPVYVDFITISPKYFKDTVQASFAERREGKFLKHFRSVDPLVRSLNAEVIRQLVANEGSKQIINIYTPRLVFPENIANVQYFIYLINEEYDTERKDIFSFGSI